MVKTWSIAVEGMVQGVGFRPHLLKKSLLLNIPIEIGNTPKGVEVKLNAETENSAHDSMQHLTADLPPKARIDNWSISESSNHIISTSKLIYPKYELTNLFITPDFSWCNSCKEEFGNPTNTRHNFLFINCTQCGSRYSIMKKLPFERENTTHKIEMCLSCKQEYNDLNNSRALSQLNACKQCFPYSHLYTDKEKKNVDEQLATLSFHIANGKIVAVQGIAGYLLLLDHRNIQGITLLRHQKNRPQKPFALMFATIDQIKENFNCSEIELKLLREASAPIVLLSPREEFKIKVKLEHISGPSQLVGVMLAPSAYLFQLCMSNNGALIATSANQHGLPLAYSIQTAKHLLSGLAVEAWYYEREIYFPQDDSVMMVSPIHHQKIIMRRSRGLSPSLIRIKNYYSPEVVLALGAELKSTFTLAYERQILVSSYQGNIATLDNFQRFTENIQKQLTLCSVQPDVILLDRHPFFQHKDFVDSFKDRPIKVKSIQHHQAHACAILGEAQLFESDDRIMCIVMDGMGYESEQFIRGAASYIYEKGKLSENEIYPSFRYLFNDKMSIDPNLSLFSILDGVAFEGMKFKFDQNYLHNIHALKTHQPLTNSIGRVFDAFAALMGFDSVNSFEGEAVLWLDQFARKGINEFGIQGPSYTWNRDSWRSLFNNCWIDLQNGLNKPTIAYCFINTLAFDIIQAVENQKVKQLALSGGVFQNAVLVDLLKSHCYANGITLHLHQELSPNDENISFGQYMHHLHITP